MSNILKTEVLKQAPLVIKTVHQIALGELAMEDFKGNKEMLLEMYRLIKQYSAEYESVRKNERVLKVKGAGK